MWKNLSSLVTGRSILTPIKSRGQRHVCISSHPSPVYCSSQGSLPLPLVCHHVQLIQHGIPSAHFLSVHHLSLLDEHKAKWQVHRFKQYSWAGRPKDSDLLIMLFSFHQLVWRYSHLRRSPSVSSCVLSEMAQPLLLDSPRWESTQADTTEHYVCDS